MNDGDHWMDDKSFDEKYGHFVIPLLFGIGLISSAFTEANQPKIMAYNNQYKYEQGAYAKEVKRIEPLIKAESKKNSLESKASSGTYLKVK